MRYKLVMLMWNVLVAAVMGVVSTVPTTAPRQAETDASRLSSMQAFEVADGLEVTVWARTPDLYNPTNIDVDARGRIWVAEAVNYRETIRPQHAMKRTEGDRIVILEDTDGDGRCDSSKTFVQDKELVAPLGVSVLGDKVVVACSPNVFVYSDTDGDDKSDHREMFLTGFGGFDTDHAVHAFVGFLDGRWYFNVGNEGPHEVTDRSGWKLNSGSLSRIRGNNTPGRRSDDGRLWVGGLALRVDGDATHLAPLGHNFRNCYEIALDSFGTMWQTDNDDDGNQSCRASWLMEGANMGYTSADGTRAWKSDQRPGQSTQMAHWHQDDPGVLPFGEITGAGGPTGVVVYEGGLLDAKYVGCVLAADAGRNVVRVLRPVADGAGYKFEVTELIKGVGEGGKLFRPSDVAVGTDGAIYVADWYDPVVGGHDMKDKEGMGRILRIAPKGDRTPAPKIDMGTPDGALVGLRSPAVNVRYQAAVALSGMGDKGAAALRKMLTGDDPIMGARAVWVLVRCGAAGAKDVEGVLATSSDERLRVAAFRALRSVNRNVLEHAAALASDPSPSVRREAALALRDVPLGKCKETLVALARGYDGRDRFYLEALGMGCDGKEEAVYPILLKQLGNVDPLKWSEPMANLAWRLHPRAAMDALAARASATTLTPTARRRAVDALAFIKDERAATAMAKIASVGPSDVRELAGWWLANRGSNDWKDYAVAKAAASAATTQESAEAAAKRTSDRELILNQSASMKERRAAALRLASDREGGLMLISLAMEKKVPADLTETISDRIYKNPDLSVRALASQYFVRKNAAGTTMPAVRDLAAMKGDASRGRAVFSSRAGGCIKCHKYDADGAEGGADIGPDLTTIRTKFRRPELLDAILNPSAAIAFGYEPWIVKTNGGQVYSGFVLSEGDTLTLKETSGEKRQIPSKDIALRKKQALSVMPDNIASGLTTQELADLAEFLLTAPVKEQRK